MRLEDLQTDPTAQYIGDGVYATFDGFQLWLHTSDGISITNSVALEPATFRSLWNYVEQRLGPKNY